jgi:autotransporter-associated beta strand protein
MLDVVKVVPAGNRFFVALALVFVFSTTAWAQTIIITNGVQNYVGLTNTTVIMSNRCELRVTAAASPLSGCIVNLNSADAYLVLPRIKPSVVVSTYLGQVRVNGAAAVADSNCRVAEYAMGTIIVPHAPSVQPLTVYSGPHFTGSAMSLSQYVYYRSSLGSMYANISSFKLKRGYIAVMAQTENGTGLSKSYIAQDGDMAVSLLPEQFDDSIRFVYVLPWRWTSKKGIAGNPGNSLLNLQWWYNWNIDQNSTRDLQYVPIRQTRWWPGLGQNWQTRGANHLLGYNEPDRPDQANMSVADAISGWPDLLGTGLRVGAPAVSDGGLGWLYDFIDEADAAGWRVDFVPVHYYRCRNPADPAGAASQFYNFLKGIYDRTRRPIWITEWNNGANWTDCGDPTYAQQQAAIAAMIDILDETPFVERYALYNWVEDVRAVVTNGVLTPAGIAYRDQQSPVGYVQALQDNGTRSFSELRFETNTLDSSGHGNNGITSGSPAYTNGVRGQAIVFDGANTVVTLPPNIATNTAFSFAAWVNWSGGGNWQRIFDFGNSTTHYMFLTPSSGSSTLRFAIKNGGSEEIVQTPALAQNQWQHVAVTLSGNTARLYLNGALVASNTGMTISPASFAPRVNTLGRSQFIADPFFKGLIDEVLITDYALSPTQLARLQTNTPPQFDDSVFSRGAATESQNYGDSIAGTASDADAGDPLTYSKAAGPAWLNVAANGALSGRPTSGDGGTNYFSVRVTDAAAQNDFAVLAIPVTVVSGSSTWIADGSGNWSETNHWSGNFVANGVGQTADFSTINITADRIVTLDSSRSIGTLRFGDTSGSQTWMLTNNGSTVLALNSGTVTKPEVAVMNTATLAIRLAGTNGFVKSGPGTLAMDGVNTCTGSTIVSNGTLRVNGLITSSTITVDANSTLAGTGTVSAANVNGTIAPGLNDIGTLAFNSMLSLNGSALMEIDRANSTNSDRIVVNGELSYGGILSVINLGPPLQDGDSFQLFSAASFAGAFTAIALPPLPNGLWWNTKLLTTSGVISVGTNVFIAPTLISAGAAWRYFDRTNDLGTAWRSNSYNDSTWSSGPARLGYGGDGEITKLASNRQWTTYFRRQFYMANPTNVFSLNARLTRDDAAVVYLNGIEVWRDTNFVSVPITNQTPALVALGGADETNWLSSSLAPSNLIAGWNLLAAEVHNQSLSSTDIGFDFELTGMLEIEALPTLSIAQSLGSLTLSAPAHASYFTLNAATNLTPPVTWSPLTNAPVLMGNEWRLHLPPATNGQGFFHLQSR